MRKLFLVLPILLAIAPNPAGAADEMNATTLNFAVTRNGEQIGTTTVRLRRSGADTVAETATHVRVTVAYITVYRFDQRETEHWAGDRLVAMNAVTDDNGTVHRVSARHQGNALAVDADGDTREVDAAVIPASLWNPSLVRRTMALNPKDGKITPVSVVDHGEEQVLLQGRPTTAHHYSIETGFPQEVWYDAQHRLVKVELRASDGSKIRYQPG